MNEIILRFLEELCLGVELCSFLFADVCCYLGVPLLGQMAKLILFRSM